MHLSTDEVLSSSSSESKMEDEVFLPNDYHFDGVDPMVIPPPIQRAPIPQQVPAATGETSGGGVMMLAAAAAAVESPPMSSVSGGGDGGESPLTWPAVSGAVVVKNAPTIPTATSVASTWPTCTINGKTFAMLIPPTYTDANAGAPMSSSSSSSIDGDAATMPPATVGEDYAAVVNYAATMPTATTTMAATGEDVAAVTIPTDVSRLWERYGGFNYTGTPAITPENGRIYAIRPIMMSPSPSRPIPLMEWWQDSSPSPVTTSAPTADAPMSSREIASRNPPQFSPISPPSSGHSAGM